MGKKKKKSSPSRKTTSHGATPTTHSKEEEEWKLLWEHAITAKEEGNAAFANQQYPQAIQAYQQGLKCLVHSSTNTTNNNNYNSTSQSQLRQLQGTLYSNRAMAWIKLEQLAAAEQDCTSSLEVWGQQEAPAKVWYRRALAREGLARIQHSRRSHDDNKEEKTSTVTKHPKTQPNWLREALQDLEHSLRALERETDDNGPKKEQMNQQIQAMKHRIQTALQQQQQSAPAASQQQSPRAVTPPPLPNAPPPPTEQKQDVLRLLSSRANVQLPDGEAFFLVDWKWWCRWCQHVQLVGVDETMEWLKLLPPGAQRPVLDDYDDTSSESDDDTATSSSSPGPIDNSRLLLLCADSVLSDYTITTSQYVYYQQWYCNDQSSKELLQPNLVRSYHYELLPREVYAALRTWYGEVTESICRRSVLNGTVQVSLYPSQERTRVEELCDACGSPGATSKCRGCMKVRYCNRTCQERHWLAYHKLECKDMTISMQHSYIRGSRVGLNNVGNTCFMNSALQCLSHATPLTRYFLSGRFRDDLNVTNPLGTGGKLATAYDTVLKDLWMRKNARSISPSSLKSAIAQFAPRFAGCLQHDAQEFLAYLVDGLHEDLNRIRRAPYVEMPDATDRDNMAAAAARAWDAHRRRNDSIVLDTFYGQFKSTCVCPNCDCVSVSFDTFNHVSLEIPHAKSAVMPMGVLVFSRKERLPVRYGFELPRSSPIKHLVMSISELSGIPFERLALCDVYENQINDLPQHHRPISDIRTDDFLIAYEVEPYSSQLIHTCLSHTLFVSGAGQNVVEKFGFPFLLSFPEDITCRDAWDMIWNEVAYMMKDPEKDRELLEIRVHDGKRRSLPLFPVYSESGDDAPTARTPYMPADSDEKLISYLGKEALQEFLHLSLDWSPDLGNEMVDDDEPVSLDDPPLDGEPELRIDEERFVTFEDHNSFKEMAARYKGEGKKAVTLDQCFEAFTKPERLDEHNTWYCSSCKKHVQAMKTMELWRLPNILIVHLKRFEFKHALRRDKLDTLVDFPLEGLDMNKHCASLQDKRGFINDKVPAIYDLFAVTNHFGRMGFGHYTAFARPWNETGLSNEWSLFDDSSVRSDNGSGPALVNSVVSPAAYVLFYRRRVFS